MRDIDLLPQWYKSGRQKQRTLRSQYMVLAGVVVIMLVWNFLAANSVSTVRAQLNSDDGEYAYAQSVIEKSQEIAGKVAKLEDKVNLVEQVDSKISVVNILSELSYLLGDEIVLSEVSFESEQIGTGARKSSGSGVRVASKSGQAELPGKVRFKGKLRGIAAQTSDVGKVVRKLEESAYFRDVTLGFSRSTEITVPSADQARQQVSEFEISFYLANYRFED